MAKTFFSEFEKCNSLKEQLDGADQGDAAMMDERKAQFDVLANAYRVGPRKSKRRRWRGKK